MQLPPLHLPDLRPALARLIARPRVAVSLAALVLIAVPLGVLSHGLSDDEDDSLVRLTASATPSSYRVLTSDAQFLSGTRAGLRIAGGALVLDAPRGAWTSPWQTPAAPFTELVPSWAATTPAGSWIKVLLQVRDTGGVASGWKDLGRWTSADGVLRRASSGPQKDAVARVSTDTLVATGRPLTGYRFVLRLVRRDGGGSPVVRAIGAVSSRPGSVPATSSPLQRSAVALAVPRYSQMTHRGQNPQYGGGGEAWCSPTSLAMVLGYYGKLPAAASYAWVPRSWPDRWVNQVARGTYDYAYRGTGNWPFNTAFAASRTGDAFVTRLSSLRMAERFIRAGIPLVLSIEFGRGQLPGAPISATPGHLVVLTGFTAAGDPVVNDPAAASNGSVRRTYGRAAFERAWLRSWGTTYVVRDAAHPLPSRPAGVTNW